MKGTYREEGKIWAFLLITNHELQREQWKFFGMGVGGVGEADTIRHDRSFWRRSEFKCGVTWESGVLVVMATPGQRVS